MEGAEGRGGRLVLNATETAPLVRREREDGSVGSRKVRKFRACKGQIMRPSGHVIAYSPLTPCGTTAMVSTYLSPFQCGWLGPCSAGHLGGANSRRGRGATNGGTREMKQAGEGSK